MSIPPFVCSTPPPPEQCEDDKDHEDFDITYSLSQEDDDDSTEYNNYGNYSSYNIYQNTSETVKKEEWNTNLSNKSENTCETKIKPEEILNAVNFITNNEIVDESIPKFEDMVVEDLNLIVDKDIVHSTDMVSKEFETEVDDEIECSNKQARIQDEGGTKITTNVNIESHVSSNIPESIDFSDRSENFQIDTVENVNVTNDVIQISSVNELPDEMKSEIEENIFTGEVVNTFVENSKPLDQEVIAVIDESPTDDDFGDFEDFQFTSTSENSQPLNVNSENPWESDCIEGTMFGDFTANFDNDTKPEVEREAKKLEELKTDTSPKEDEDDDFGDFDDFRSSDKTESVVDTNEVTSTPDVTLWNLSSPDNDPQIVDSINSVLVPIFVDEIHSPVNELCGMLESFLGETWGHMIDIEVRQPYMVSWNNSLGQKTLLKALCIDSRNILFGPKWNYNMPKYATNLTAAPLQPQKQIAPSTSSSDTAERVINKEAGAWVDPFTPDGQQWSAYDLQTVNIQGCGMRMPCFVTLGDRIPVNVRFHADFVSRQLDQDVIIQINFVHARTPVTPEPCETVMCPVRTDAETSFTSVMSVPTNMALNQRGYLQWRVYNEVGQRVLCYQVMVQTQNFVQKFLRHHLAVLDAKIEALPFLRPSFKTNFFNSTLLLSKLITKK